MKPLRVKRVGPRSSRAVGFSLGATRSGVSVWFTGSLSGPFRLPARCRAPRDAFSTVGRTPRRTRVQFFTRTTLSLAAGGDRRRPSLADVGVIPGQFRVRHPVQAPRAHSLRGCPNDALRMRSGKPSWVNGSLPNARYSPDVGHARARNRRGGFFPRRFCVMVGGE